jgi:hypothetical protein
LHSVGPDSQHSGTTVQHQVPQQGCLSATAGHAIFEVARSGGTGRRSRLKICRSFALCGFDSLLRDHPSCNSLILLLRRSIILGAPFTLWTFLGVDQGLAVWRPRARDGILFRGGWHDVTLLGASRLSGNGRRGNYGLSDLLDERISRFRAPTAHAENIAFPVSPAPRRVHSHSHGHQISGSNGPAAEAGQIAGVSASGGTQAGAGAKAIRRRRIRE